MFVSILQGTTKFSSSTIGAIQNKADLKDEDLAFVAGATGRVGSRTVRSYSIAHFTSKVCFFHDDPWFQNFLTGHIFLQGASETWIQSQSWC